MSEQRKLSERVATLEHQMTETRRDCTDALTLAKAADRDVSGFRGELRDHRMALNALGEAQRELSDQMRAGFAEVHAELAEMNSEISRLRDGIGNVAVGQAQMTVLLTEALKRDGFNPGGATQEE
jgi:chromosome segregation ATPase